MRKIFLLITILFLMPIKTSAVNYITDAGFYNCYVNTNSLNIRSGPGTNYGVVKVVNKGTNLRALGKIKNWYLVQTNDDVFGMVNGWYISPTNTNNIVNNTVLENKASETLTNDEKTILNLVNKARKEAGFTELKVDTKLMEVAELKSKDMEDKNYFSHTSPTYGSPFDMMKTFGITYKSAGENIAGYSTAQKAFEGWMNSEGHRANILNSSYNYTGIGIVDSKRYGKLFTQMFIGR